MKKFFGILLIVVGLITLTKVISPNGAETLGGLIGVSLFTFLPAYFLLRTKKIENLKADIITENQNISNSTLNTSTETYWQDYKRKNLRNSYEIEKLTGLDFSTLNNKDAREKVESLERWSNNTNTPISQLKQYFLNTFIPKFTFDELPEILNELPQKKIEEANTFNISEQNTCSYWIIKWLKDFIEEKVGLYVDDDDLEESFTNEVKPQKKSLESYLDGLDSDTMDSMLEILSETNSKEEVFLKIKKLLE